MLGTLIGSYLATIAIRWPEGESASSGRSRCDGCGRVLHPAELVPILSYSWLRGRCRRCGARIASLHPWTELAAGLVAAVPLLFLPLPQALVSACFGWALLLIGLLDLRHHWLPDRLTLPLLAAGLALAALPPGPPLADRLIGAAAGFAALWAIGWGYRRARGRVGLGGGDPKLLAAIGAWLGWQQLPVVMLGAGSLGLLAVAALRLAGRPISPADRLPLGSLMAAAAWPLWLNMIGG